MKALITNNIKSYNTGCNFYDNKDFHKAYAIFIELAKENNTDAQFMVANMLITGTGVVKNIDDGYRWMEKVANKNEPEAMFLYGWYLISQHKEEQGVQYVKRSAIKYNFINAIESLAGFYYYGLYGVRQNFKKSYCLYKKAFFSGKKSAFDGLLSSRAKIKGKYNTIIYFFKKPI